jgi:hypothetical protein
MILRMNKFISLKNINLFGRHEVRTEFCMLSEMNFNFKMLNDLAKLKKNDKV